jgi:hypothetical protein
MKADKQFDFAGGLYLAHDVKLVYEGPRDLGYSRAAGYLDGLAT